MRLGLRESASLLAFSVSAKGSLIPQPTLGSDFLALWQPSFLFNIDRGREVPAPFSQDIPQPAALGSFSCPVYPYYTLSSSLSPTYLA